MKIRQITYSEAGPTPYTNSVVPIPVEPDMEADWTLVAALWQEVITQYGGICWRWVWFWEGVRP